MTAPREPCPTLRPCPWPGAPARRAGRIYGLLTSVRFAVVQIVAIAVAGVVGIVVPQLPGVAFRSPADYAEQMEILRARVEPSLGPALTDLFETLGFFRVFTRLVVHGAPRAPRRLHRGLHPGPDAAPLALGAGRAGRPAGRRSTTRRCRTGR